MSNLESKVLNKKEGYISLWRSITKWQWYTEVNTCKLFIHLLIRANRTRTEWRGIVVERGSLITSRQHLAVETGLSEQSVRTALNNLKKTHEITSKSTSRYSIITLKNYDFYQEPNQQRHSEITSNQPATNQPLTTDNNKINKINEINNNIISSSCNNEEKTTSTASDISDLNINRINDLKNFYGEYSNVHLDSRQMDSLKALILNDSILEELINELSENIEQGKENLYSEKTPAMHYIRLKKYWNYRKNKPVVTENNYSNGRKSARQRVVDYLINTGQMTEDGEFIE